MIKITCSTKLIFFNCSAIALAIVGFKQGIGIAFLSLGESVTQMFRLMAKSTSLTTNFVLSLSFLIAKSEHIPLICRNSGTYLVKVLAAAS